MTVVSAGDGASLHRLVGQVVVGIRAGGAADDGAPNAPPLPWYAENATVADAKLMV